MWFFWLGPCRSTVLESSSIERGVCLKQRMVLMVCAIEKQGQFFLFGLWQLCMSFGVQDRSTCKYCCCLFLVQFSVISSADAVRKSLIFAWIVVHSCTVWLFSYVAVLFCDLLHRLFWWTRSKCCFRSEYGHTQVTEPTRVCQTSVSPFVLTVQLHNFSHCS
jgi:hypothetical protein